MPFVPLFAEIAESQIIDKLMALLYRDFKLALDYYYVADALPDFAVMARGDVSVFNYPMVVLGVERMTSQETENGEWLSQNLTIGAGMVVEDTTVAAVTKKAEKYVRAFKAVVRKGVLEVLPGTSALVDYTVDIDHRYFRHGSKGTAYQQPVEFEIKISFGEK